MVEKRILTQFNADMIAEWCGGRAVIQHDALDYDLATPGVNVPTMDGVERAQVGDMVVQERDGSFRIQKRGGRNEWRTTTTDR
jgi:hypothetical protein